MKNDKNKLVGIVLIIALCLPFQSCRNNDFDLSDLDATMGFGGDSLSLPGNNSTDSIKLDDLLKLDNSDFVKIMDNGDYSFMKADDNLSPAHPIINKVEVSRSNTTSYSISIFSENKTKTHSLKRVSNNINNFSGSIAAFDYSYNDVPSEILSLDETATDAKISIVVSFSDVLKSNVSSFETLNMTLPAFLKVKSVTCNNQLISVNSNNQINLKNVSTSSNLTIIVNTSALDFNAKENIDQKNELKFTNGNIKMLGYIDVSGTFDGSNISTSTKSSDYKMTGSMSLNGLTITGATGKFCPNINFNNLGTVTLNNIPDFLKDNDVKIDLYNPQILLTINSDMPVKGLISGILTSKYDDGKADVNVTIPQFSVKANTDGNSSTTTTVCICKNKNALSGTYDEVVEVPTLSDIVKSIPKTITFGNINAKGDGSVKSSIELGKAYNISPAYEMVAPLSFSEDAQIVYRDTLDGWNDDAKRLSISNQILVTADVVNKIPIYLSVTGQAIDVNKQLISEDKINITVEPTVPAYNTETKKDGTTVLTITIKQNDKDAFKNLDGIIIKATGAAKADGQSPVVGTTINAYHQKLVLKNIKAKIIGKIIADLN